MLLQMLLGNDSWVAETGEWWSALATSPSTSPQELGMRERGLHQRRHVVEWLILASAQCTGVA